jgi:hypothetical protein
LCDLRQWHRHQLLDLRESDALVKPDSALVERPHFQSDAAGAKIPRNLGRAADERFANTLAPVRRFDYQHHDVKQLFRVLKVARRAVNPFVLKITDDLPIF